MNLFMLKAFADEIYIVSFSPDAAFFSILALTLNKAIEKITK